MDPDPQLKEALNAKLIESGERERLKELVRSRLVECGWRDEMKLKAKEIVKERGVDKISVDDLVSEITPKGRGIPISYQHLVWNSMELQDEFCLQDYNITHGTTLKLILGMRGGPINSRRTAATVVDEWADYSPAPAGSGDEESPGNPPPGHVTVLVLRDGDELNFFRVIERPDGRESSSDSDRRPPVDRATNMRTLRENQEMQQKINLLREKMQKLSINKQKLRVPRPPSTGRQVRNFSHRQQQTSRVRPKSGSAGKRRKSPNTGVSFSENLVEMLPKPAPPPAPAATDIAGTKLSAGEKNSPAATKSHKEQPDENVGSQSLYQPLHVAITPRPPTVPKHRSLHTPHSSTPGPATQRSDGLGRIKESTTVATPSEEALDELFDLTTSGRVTGVQRSTGELLSPEELNYLISPRSSVAKSRLTGSTQGQTRPVHPNDEFYFESLSRDQARVFSGLLRQASLEPLSMLTLKSRPTSSRLGSGRKSRSRKAREEQRPNLPPVVKGRKRPRCEICWRKTGLATSYSCRCGRNFCATHRYPEAHQCNYDFKSPGRKLLEQSNPVVTAPKLPKI